MKNIRCKKCGKLLAKIKGTNIAIQGRTNAEISQGDYVFKCIICQTKAKGTVN